MHALYDHRTLQRPACDLSASARKRPDDARRTRVRFELDCCRSENLLATDAHRRGIALPARDRQLERLGGFRNRSRSYISGSGGINGKTPLEEDVGSPPELHPKPHA